MKKNKNSWKEKFWKMNQLDRVEYFLHQEYIKERYAIQTFNFISSIIYVIGAILVLALLMFIAFENISLFKIIPSLITIFKYLLILIIIIDTINFMLKHYAFNVLDEKFGMKKKTSKRSKDNKSMIKEIFSNGETTMAVAWLMLIMGLVFGYLIKG